MTSCVSRHKVSQNSSTCNDGNDGDGVDTGLLPTCRSVQHVTTAIVMSDNSQYRESLFKCRRLISMYLVPPGSQQLMDPPLVTCYTSLTTSEYWSHCLSSGIRGLSSSSASYTWLQFHVALMTRWLHWLLMSSRHPPPTPGVTLSHLTSESSRPSTCSSLSIFALLSSCLSLTIVCLGLCLSFVVNRRFLSSVVCRAQLSELPCTSKTLHKSHYCPR